MTGRERVVHQPGSAAPWIELVLLLTFLFGFAAAVVHQEWRLWPHGAAQIGFLTLGVLAFLVVLYGGQLAERHNSRAFIQVGFIVLTCGCAFSGVTVGLGWSRLGRNSDPEAFPRGAQCLAAGFVVGFVSILGGLAVRLGPRML